MLSLLTINWNPDPELFKLFGTISIRYYGLLWLVGLALAFFIVRKEYRDRKISDELFEPLFFYCFFGILIGSRLGHCLFYDFDRYFTSTTGIIEMLLPIDITPNGWKLVGYQGLASHGGTAGLIIALFLYCRKTKMHYVDVLDMIAVATPITACCIRLANLMNSEIIGKPTDMPWAFVFERVDMLPRHPGQLYEAIAYFIFFLGMMYLYKRGQKQQEETKPQTNFKATKAHQTAIPSTGIPSVYPRGFFFGLCLTEIFVFRFFIEFLKENQVTFEDGMTLNMGQWLSIPFVIVGIYFMFFYGKKAEK
ncbi:MAG: prolipoprotein diacylglyceryl transferase [Bacteroides sp.]|nr:prolipoprotein diacylglyceryl transferase [Bacteroides sp.]